MHHYFPAPSLLFSSPPSSPVSMGRGRRALLQAILSCLVLGGGGGAPGQGTGSLGSRLTHSALIPPNERSMPCPFRHPEEHVCLAMEHGLGWSVKQPRRSM